MGAIRSAASSTTKVILTAVGVGGLFYWLLKRSGDGPGFGLGIGGLGGSKLFEQGGGGPSAAV